MLYIWPGHINIIYYNTSLVIVKTNESLHIKKKKGQRRASSF